MTFLKRILCHSLILCAAAICQGQSADVKQKATASISGRVTIDEKAAPGILVSVSPVGSSNSGGRAMSDTDGHFQITGINAGQYAVTPFAPTYVLRQFNPMVGGSVNLSAGESIDDLDFKLTKGGVITGRVTDEEGKPVIEERISLVQVDENGAQVRQQLARIFVLQTYQTDDRGMYRIYGLPAGHYKVSAGEEAGRSAVLRSGGYHQKTFYPDSTDINKASIVDLRPGAEAKKIDIRLGHRATTFTAIGRIVDADTGQPLAGVQYSFGLIQKSQNESYVEGSTSPGTPTNAQGEFRLEGLDPGRYVVLVSSSGFSPDPPPASRFYSEPVTFEVIDSDVTDLEIKAQRTLAISGVVLVEGTTDKNVLARLTRLRVSASVNPGRDSGINMIVSNGGLSAINPDGSFQISGLHPGKAQINVGAFTASDSQGFTLSRIEYDGVVQNREGMLPAIEIRPGRDVSGVRIYVAYGTGVVRGEVKVEGGALPSDVVMFVTLMRESELGRWTGQVDSRGRFVIKGIPAGTYVAMMQIISFGSLSPLPRGVARQQKQTVTVANDAESQVLFILDVTAK